jgi:hypothetical protein
LLRETRTAKEPAVPCKSTQRSRALVRFLAFAVLVVSGCSLGAYDKCRKKVTTLDDMDDCMRAGGYAFVNENAAWDPSIGECWDDRYADKIPMAYCYVQVGPPVPGGYEP